MNDLWVFLKKEAVVILFSIWYPIWQPHDAIISKNDIWVILLWGLSYILLKYISGNCHLNSLKTKKATCKSKHWIEYRLNANGACGQCFRPFSQVLRFRLTWNFIIRLRLTKYTCRIKFWLCLNLSFSFLHFRISHILFHIYKCGHRNVLSKRQVWMSIFHIINFKKKQFMDTGVLDF